MAEQTIPNHVAIIPDGNRRWAKKQGLQPSLGHKEGMQRFWDISEALFTQGVVYVTLWAASIDNVQKRNPLEIQFLVNLGKQQLADEALIQRFVDNGVRVRVVGKWNELLADDGLADVIAHLESATDAGTKHTLTILFGYDGISEMIDAIPNAAVSLPVTYVSVKQSLATGFLPEVDLMIRTAGEPHWSAGFTMWLTANSQFYFTDTFWPAFDQQELTRALDDFASRERKFGK